VREIAKGLE